MARGNLNRTNILDEANDKIVALTVEGGTPKVIYDGTANDSDKTFTVPNGKVWRLSYVHAEIKCTATAGNRAFRVAIYNTTPNLVLPYLACTTVFTATQTGVIEEYVGATFSTTAAQVPPLLDDFTPTQVKRVAIPPDLYLPAGYYIRVADMAAVDAAADDVWVVLHYIEYDA